MSMQTISPEDLYELARKSDVDLIDVRTPAEYRHVHADMARLEPLDRLDPKRIMSGRTGRDNEPLYVICKSGARSRKACEQFIAAGFTNVINVDGGTEAWAKHGLPVQRGQWVLPLDQQVQLIAGLIALTGVLLAIKADPNWIWLAGFVGAGLTFAGLTGCCPMARLLARMPWNQGDECRSCG